MVLLGAKVKMMQCRAIATILLLQDRIEFSCSAPESKDIKCSNLQHLPVPPDLSPMIPISRSTSGWEEGASEFLVNSKLGMNGLTELLARLEDLSHILAWSDRVPWSFWSFRGEIQGLELVGMIGSR